MLYDNYIYLNEAGKKRNANSQAQPQIYCMGNSGVGPSNLSCMGFCACQLLPKTHSIYLCGYQGRKLGVGGKWGKAEVGGGANLTPQCLHQDGGYSKILWDKASHSFVLHLLPS